MSIAESAPSGGDEDHEVWHLRLPRCLNRRAFGVGNDRRGRGLNKPVGQVVNQDLLDGILARHITVTNLHQQFPGLQDIDSAFGRDPE